MQWYSDCNTLTQTKKCVKKIGITVKISQRIPSGQERNVLTRKMQFGHKEEHTEEESKT